MKQKRPAEVRRPLYFRLIFPVNTYRIPSASYRILYDDGDDDGQYVWYVDSCCRFAVEIKKACKTLQTPLVSF